MAGSIILVQHGIVEDRLGAERRVELMVAGDRPKK
jgi:hypothetical protein